MIAEAYKPNGGYFIKGGTMGSVSEAIGDYKSERVVEGMKYDSGKLLISLVQPEFIKGVAEVLTFGANKYAPNSWQTVPDAKRRYEDALYRHWLDYLSGERRDTESGLEHLKHLATNAMFLLYLTKEEDN